MERTPTATVPAEIGQGRIQMFLEELEEYRAAVHNHDIVEIADALTDIFTYCWVRSSRMVWMNERI